MIGAIITVLAALFLLELILYFWRVRRIESEPVTNARYWLEFFRKDPEKLFAKDFFLKYVRETGKNLGFFGTDEKELAWLDRIGNIKNARYWLNFFQNDPERLFAADFFLHHAKDAGEDISFFGITKEKLAGLNLLGNIKNVIFWIKRFLQYPEQSIALDYAQYHTEAAGDLLPSLA